MASPGGRKTPSKQQYDAILISLEQEKQNVKEEKELSTRLRSTIRSLKDKLASVLGTLKDPSGDPISGERKDDGDYSMELRR